MGDNTKCALRGRPDGRGLHARGRLLRALIAAAGMAFITLASADEPYPSHPVKLVTWSSPGGTVDIFARLIAEQLTRKWGQSVYVENKIGAAGVIASEYVAKSKPDGYTLFLPTVSSQIMGPLTKARLPYDPIKDFEPVSLLVSGPYVLVAPPGAPFNNIKELLAYSRTRPEGVTYGSVGPGSAHNLIAESLAQKNQGKLVQVPYKSGEMAMLNDMIGGSLDAAVWTQTVARNMQQNGKIKLLGVTGATRNKSLPDVPTLLEQGYPGFEVTGWIGIYTPAGAPKAVIEKIASAVKEVIVLPDVQSRINEFGFDTIASTPDEFRRTFERDFQRWGDMVRAAGIVPE